MGHKVNFINISNDDYQNLENKDLYTFYNCYDAETCFLGENEITNQELDNLINNLQKEVEQTQDTLQWNTMRPALTDLTISEIQSIIKEGKADNYWSIGDKIAITLNGDVSTYTFDNEVCYAYIIGFDHNTDIETNGQYSVTFQFGKTENDIDIAFVDPNYDGTATAGGGFQMNTSNINTNGWENSHMRTLCQDFYRVLPQDWQDIISAATKYTNNQGDSSNTSAVWDTQDQIFLLSEYEVTGTRVYANSYEQGYQKQYNYYADGSKNIKYKHLNSNTTTAWWLRSPYYNNSYSFCYVSSSGVLSRYNANVSYGFSPAFVVS